jgi:hypothetical protein
LLLFLLLRLLANCDVLPAGAPPAPAVLFAVLSVMLEEEDYSLGFNDGYDEAYPDAYEESYEEAAAAAGPVVHAEEIKELAQQSLAKKKEERVVHAVLAAAVPVAAV